MKNINKITKEILASNSKRFYLGSGVICYLKETKDEQGFKIKLEGSFRSGNSIEDTQKQLEKFWNTLDIDA
jgi:hypothetical protein